MRSFLSIVRNQNFKKTSKQISERKKHTHASVKQLESKCETTIKWRRSSQKKKQNQSEQEEQMAIAH